MESLIERLRALAEAYPVDVFPALTKEQTNAHPEIVTRASASMGRHFSPVFTQAADEIERLRRGAVERELIVAAALDALEATPGVGHFRATASALRKTINAASAATCEQGANA